MEDDVRHYQYGVRLLKAGQALEALDHLRRAATTGVDRAVEHFALAVAAERAGLADEAMAEYASFLRFPPEERADRQNEAARTALARLQSVSPRGPDPSRVEAEQQALAALRRLFAEAVDAFEAGHFEAALDAFQVASERFGATAELKSNEGLCLMRLGRLDDAEGVLREAISLDTSFSPAKVNLGRLFFERGARSALAQFKKALAEDAECFDALYNMGIVYSHLGEREAARHAFTKALALDPSNLQVKGHLDAL